MDHQDIAASVLEPQNAAPNVPADELQTIPLLRALEAGWTTPEDRAFVVPILAWVHSVLIEGSGKRVLRDEGENSSADDAAFLGGRQADGYRAAMDSLGAVGLDGISVPSFARHFTSVAFALRVTDRLDVASAVFRFNMHISAQVLAALELAMEKAEAAVGQRVAPASREYPKFDGDTSKQVWEKLLSLHLAFYADLYAAMRFHRFDGAAARIQSRRSLEIEAEPPVALFPGVGEIMCREFDAQRDIEFTVERYPCTAEVLDPRVVRIPVGKYNNRHKHAHETLFYFVSGTGEILVGETWVKVKPGDAVFSPRWAIHQTHNTGSEELVLLAITDYYLTSQVYVGKYDKI